MENLVKVSVRVFGKSVGGYRGIWKCWGLEIALLLQK